MNKVSFINPNHTSTSRNYLSRVIEVDKAKAAEKACLWDFDYWDGDRANGYGGYTYDGRWRKVAKSLISHYKLKDGMCVLDVGCGKGFLLKDLLEELPGLNVVGIDRSDYAITHCEPEIKEFCQVGYASDLPFKDGQFDLTLSINTLHNLFNFELDKALSEIRRVTKKSSFICVESYRNEREKVNLLYWQLTCRAFLTPDEWGYVFEKNCYEGDVEFIFFE